MRKITEFRGRVHLTVATCVLPFVAIVLQVGPTFASGAECRDLFQPILRETSPELARWLEAEAETASTKIRENISREDGLPGAIIAARTRVSPNYYYHWIRDAGLVVDALIARYELSIDVAERLSIRKKVFEYLEFSRKIQNVETLTGLGEPKIHVDGTSFTEMWGRPQNDSPAIRAISMVDFAKILEKHRLSGLVNNKLYDGKFPSQSVIKKDLEYVAHNWKKPSWDIWEEVLGDHFYTRIVQRRALLDGAALAERQRDPGAAAFYREQAFEISNDLRSFWDADRGYLMVTRPSLDLSQNKGLDNKTSGLDIAVILGLLHGSRGDSFLSFNHPWVMATLEKLEATFAAQYAINKRADIPGLAIGRYPEDAFSGADRSGGNPWVLATLAMAEAYYRAAQEVRGSDAARASQLIAKGDSFVARVRYHAHKDGSLNEQFHHTTGFMHSVEDLTWSYAALLTAHNARTLAVGRTSKNVTGLGSSR